MLIPLPAGVGIGRWVDRELEFFGNTRARLLATSMAAAIAVGAIGLLTWLGNGAVGVERLSSVGPPVCQSSGRFWSKWSPAASSGPAGGPAGARHRGTVTPTRRKPAPERARSLSCSQPLVPAASGLTEQAS